MSLFSKNRLSYEVLLTLHASLTFLFGGKAPWPTQLTEGRAYVGLMALDPSPSQWGSKAPDHSVEAGRAGGLHLETESRTGNGGNLLKPLGPSPEAYFLKQGHTS